MTAPIAHSRKAIDLYRLFGLTDTRSDQARAEEALTLVLGANPDLAPEGWCTSPALIERAIRERGQPGTVFRPRLVEAFAWCRVFLTLGCRRVPRGDWNTTPTNRMAFLAERAFEKLNRRTLPVEQGVVAAAALSLGIEISKGDKGLCAWLAAYATWEWGR